MGWGSLEVNNSDILLTSVIYSLPFLTIARFWPMNGKGATQRCRPHLPHPLSLTNTTKLVETNST